MRPTRPFFFFLTFSLGLVSGRREAGLDEVQYGDLPRPTPEPVLYQDEFRHGPILKEFRPGHLRNGTSRNDLALGARQVCDPPRAVGQS